MSITIRFLGTSAAIPTSSRGLPGIALKIDGTIVLFDCGEGTQRSLMEAGWKISRIHLICISHLHADHVGGLLGLLATREFQGIEQPLTILGPPGIKNYTECVLNHTYSHIQYPLEINELHGNDGTCFQHDEFDIQWAPLKHRVPTVGFLFVEKDKPGTFDVKRAERLGIEPGPLYGELKAGKDIMLPDGRTIDAKSMVGPPTPGRKIAVIWDTRPCPGAYHLAKDTDMLIFDGTFTQTHREEADASDHCTAAQAAKVAQKSNAKKLILTHISARYNDSETHLDEAQPIFENTVIAHDGMEINVNP